MIVVELLSHASFHFLGVLGHAELLDEVFDLTIHDVVKIIDRIANPVIGHASLRIIVGPDLIRTVTATHHGAALAGDFIVMFFELDFVESGAEHFECFIVVGMLGATILTFDHQT